jgi:DNA-binding beta-propeller fold protein YncE
MSVRVVLAAGLAAAVAAASPAAAPPVAVTFTQPTSIELEPSGKLLVVEQSVGRIRRLDPATGRTSVVVGGLGHPYALVRARNGTLYYSVAKTIRRVGGGVVARSTADIGPLAAASGGALFYATSRGVFRVGGARLAPGEPLQEPHGLAVAKDGSLLVSDTGGNRVVRVDPGGAATTFGRVASPRGIDVARDGTVYVIDAANRRVRRFAADGSPLGWLGGRLPGDPYDLRSAPNGAVYVLEAGEVGDVRKIDARGRVVVVARP